MYDSYSLLSDAAGEDHDHMVQLFLDEADNNAQSGIMKTLSKELLDEGADFNAQSGHDGNALRAASLRGHSHVGSGSKSRLKAKKEISEVSGACTLLGSGFFALQNLCISTKTLASKSRRQYRLYK